VLDPFCWGLCAGLPWQARATGLLFSFAAPGADKMSSTLIFSKTNDALFDLAEIPATMVGGKSGPKLFLSKNLFFNLF